MDDINCQRCGKRLIEMNVRVHGPEPFAFCNNVCAFQWAINVDMDALPSEATRLPNRVGSMRDALRELRPIVVGSGELTRGNVEWFH